MSDPRLGGRTDRGSERRRAAIAAILLALTCRCDWMRPARDAPPRSPEEAALRVFDLARATDPGLADLKRVMNGKLIEDDRSSAFEAVAALRDASGPRVLAAIPLVGVGRTAIDVTADLPGGGSARCSFQAEVDPDGGWRIVSIHAPGVDWPGHSKAGSGLSVSSPAGETPRSR